MKHQCGGKIIESKSVNIWIHPVTNTVNIYIDEQYRALTITDPLIIRLNGKTITTTKELKNQSE